jgi:hypothetical protein
MEADLKDYTSSCSDDDKENSGKSLYFNDLLIMQLYWGLQGECVGQFS